jgi:RNA-directed DNA polymerase
MERSNQLPKIECCRQEGQARVATEAARPNDRAEAYTERLTGRMQDSHPAEAIQPRDGTYKQAGTEFPITEPNTSRTVTGEERLGLPGSKSVADEQRTARNLGEPAPSRRTNCESQAGRRAQRQEVNFQEAQAVRSVLSSRQADPPVNRQAGEGTDGVAQAAKETSAVGETETGWRTSLQAIARKAKEQKRHRFGGLYRLINEEALRDCYFQLRKEAACGVDEVTWKDYGKNLRENLAQLNERLKHKSYHAKLVRRKYIPKGEGKFRPLGIPALEDKIVQLAAARILNAIYEADFLPCSWGYRPGRSAREASRELEAALSRGRYEFVVEADIKGYFEHIGWEWLLKMLSHRINDGALLGLINKWLKAGILEEDGRVIHPETGTPQGGIVSPVLANVYLHYVLDLWFEHQMRKANRGQSMLMRYADDFVCAFGWRHEAEEFLSLLKGRLARFGLEVAPDKTRQLRFGRKGGPHNGRFDFLGFEFYWKLSRRGKPMVSRRTAPKRLRRSVANFTAWVREQRHRKLPLLMKGLASKYRGTWNYYGVRGNSRSLEQFWQQTRWILLKWLNRRSQKRSYTQRTFARLLRRFRIPAPSIKECAPLANEPNRAAAETALNQLFRRYNAPEACA